MDDRDRLGMSEADAFAYLRGERPTTAADGFLHLLKAEPSLLNRAPTGYTSRDMDRRAARNLPCLRCGKREPEIHVCAIVADLPDGPRWVDLCMACVNWLQDGMTPDRLV